MVSAMKRLALGVGLIFLASAVLLLSDLTQRRSVSSQTPRVAIFQYATVRPLDQGVLGALAGLADEGFVRG